MVDTAGDEPELTATKLAELPLPLAAIPVAVLLFTHRYVTMPPKLGDVKSNLIFEPLHTT
jgi:hypothetical protein